MNALQALQRAQRAQQLHERRIDVQLPIEAICIHCGGEIAPVLVRGGSLACHSCRDFALPPAAAQPSSPSWAAAADDSANRAASTVTAGGGTREPALQRTHPKPATAGNGAPVAYFPDVVFGHVLYGLAERAEAA